MSRTVIIGNGIAGSTCARWLRKLCEDEIILISDESDAFFSRTGMMYVYMGHLRWMDLEPYEPWFWKKNRIQCVLDRANAFDFRQKTIQLEKGTLLGYDRLVLALGSLPNRLEIPGAHLDGVTGFYHKQDLDYIERISPSVKQAVVVGGGLIGIELAEMFHSRNIEVRMLVREKAYWNAVLPHEEAQMISRHIRQKGIHLELETNLQAFHGQNGVVESVTSDQGIRWPCQLVGLAIGVRPNIDLCKQTDLETDRGILVDDFLQTNLPNVYAIGDCAQLRNPANGRKPVEAIWYAGRKMGECLAGHLAGQNQTYSPGIWFNSAKFLDIEYQVYGWVPKQFDHQTDALYWEHANGQKSIRIVFDTSSKAVLGFNLMGIRFRQEVCEKWISTATSLKDVLGSIRLAFFDPEFYPDYAKDLYGCYTKKTGQSIQASASGKLNDVLRFLKS